MIYRLKYAKSESNFDADFEHPTLQGVWGKLAKSKVSIMYARVECYFLYKGGDVLHHDSRKP